MHRYSAARDVRYSECVLQHISDLAPLAWVLLAFAALLIGVSKTAIPGIIPISVAIFASFLPPKESTAALLALLIVGDVFALLTYRHHADIRTLLRLIPTVALGIVAGAFFLAIADDGWVRRVIGGILLLLIVFTLWQKYGRSAPRQNAPSGPGSIARSGYGVLGGFTTMVANAGGPVMSLYFLSAGFQVKAFLGTAAWFFAVVNLTKVPVLIGLGLFTPRVLAVDLMLVPMVVIGAFAGRWITKRMNQRAFEFLVIFFTIAGAIYLLVQPA